ncbi:MAG: DUF72 domain-containing protein [Cyclonatronaceae bacterium]
MKHHVGCSGFNYDDWEEAFYPKDIRKKDWLEYYATRFDTVEINSTFYHLPKEKTLDNWYDRTPGNFRFTLKGSRFITHQKKLNDPQEPVKKFQGLAARLKGKLGCILWQLPGNQTKDIGKLDTFCRTLGGDFRNVIEFRHNSWFDQEVYDVMNNYDVSFCMISAPGELREDAVKTSDLAYLRFHGKEEWYKYLYSEKELKDWAEKIRQLNAQQVYAYFNNDQDANAPRNAADFRKILD